MSLYVPSYLKPGLVPKIGASKTRNGHSRTKDCGSVVRANLTNSKKRRVVSLYGKSHKTLVLIYWD